MKFKATVLGVAVMALLSSAAHAGSNWIGLTGGLGVPTGDYDNVATNGWHLGATGTHMLNKQWGIGGDVAYHAWGGSSDMNAAAEALAGPGSKFYWSAIQATAHAMMNFPTRSNVKPYATLGLGMYDMGLKLDTTSGSTNETKGEFGFNLGGGMNFAARGNMSWGLDGTYHVVQSENDLGANVDFFQLGLNVKWGGN